MNEKILDMRGLDCPLPAVRFKEAMRKCKDSCDNFKIICDSASVRENIMRIAIEYGFFVEFEESAESCEVMILLLTRN